jgi:hypothetical protein
MRRRQRLRIFLAMDRTPPFVALAPMERNGAYNRSSRVQASGLLPAVSLLEEAAREVPLPAPPQIPLIADYGASEGRNSLEPIAAALARLRERVGPERAVLVAHTDLPGNDFSALFETLATDAGSYLRSDAAAFPAAVGRSYFEQILPSGSVALGWSSWAIQWLSRVPAAIPDHVQVAFSGDTTARAAFARQAAEDWATFLAMRSRELCAGGRIVVVTMATDDSGDFGYRPVLDAMVSALQDLVAQGIMDAAELRRMVIPTFGRTRAQFAEPFTTSGRFEKLSLEHVEVFHGEDRIWAQFEADHDAHAFGAQWAAFSRASVFPTLAEALTGAANDPRRAAFMDRLEAGMAARLSSQPQRVSIPLARMVIVKAAGPSTT